MVATTLGNYAGLAIFMVVMVIIVSVSMWLARREASQQRELADDWRVLAEGEFEYVVYGHYDYIKSYRTGAMVHTSHTKTITMDVTAVYFQDGRSCIGEGRCDMLFPRGSKIRIWRNGFGKFRLEKVE